MMTERMAESNDVSLKSSSPPVSAENSLRLHSHSHSHPFPRPHSHPPPPPPPPLQLPPPPPSPSQQPQPPLQLRPQPQPHQSQRVILRSPPTVPQPLSTTTTTTSSPTTTTTSAISSTITTPLQTPHKDSPSLNPSPLASKRSSFIESVGSRSYSVSPRIQRTSSFSSSALADLLMQSGSKTNAADGRFKDRDWRSIQVHEIIDPHETRFVELDTTIEDTTKLLIRSGAPNVVLVRKSRKTKTCIGVFDYSNLNAYLLLVLGLTQPDEKAAEIAARARAGEAIPLKDIQDHMGTCAEPAFLPHAATLAQAMEILGGGHHRVMINQDGTTETVGILTQLRLVRFFWENHQNFAPTEKLYQSSLIELELGAKEVMAINGDKPVADALRLMHDEGITSLPVLDQQRNVIGNISQVDTQLLTDTSAIPLLSGTCIHFISVILSERGVVDGKDSFPVFYVTPYSTLAHAVAKLCATRSHRMWIVDAPSPSTSVPPSPGPSQVASPFGSSQAQGGSSNQHHTPVKPSGRQSIGSEYVAAPPSPYPSISPVLSQSAMQAHASASISGRLSGVVSLTDILNLFARASGLHPGDPEETRRRRRQSSSSNLRPSIDALRSSPADLSRSVGQLARSTSRTSISNMR